MKAKPIKVKLDKERNLYFTMGSLSAALNRCGVPFLDVQKAAAAAQDENNFALFIWGGLITEDAMLTIEKVRSVLGEYFSGPEGLTRAAYLRADLTNALEQFSHDTEARAADAFEILCAEEEEKIRAELKEKGHA